MGKLVLLAGLFLGQIDQSVPLAIEDANKVPESARHSIRYLTLDNFPEKERPELIKLLSVHVNSLSKESDLTSVYVVPKSNGGLLRVTLDDYGWKRDVWEQFAADDPYFHVRVQTITETVQADEVQVVEEKVVLPADFNDYKWIPGQKENERYLEYKGKTIGGLSIEDGVYRKAVGTSWGPPTASPIPLPKEVKVQPKVAPKVQPKQVKEVKREKKNGGGKTELAFAPWITPKVAELSILLNSNAPIMRADWWFNQTAAQVDRKVGYYGMLGIKSEEDFQKLVGFDVKRERRKVELREAVAKSGVTLQARAIVRESAEDGGYWKTFDFRRSVDKVNPLRVLGRDIEEQFKAADPGDVASEQYGFLPNGLWATFLGNNKGVAQNTAPDFVASDSMSKSNDRRISVNISCIRCHVNGGLQDVNGWARNLLQPPLALVSADYQTIRLLRQQYIRKLEPFITKDRQSYSDVVLELSGYKAPEYAGKYAVFWERYEDASVDSVWASRDAGMAEKDFLDALKNYELVQQDRKLDPVLSVYLSANPVERIIPIRQYEEVLPIMFETIQASK